MKAKPHIGLIAILMMFPQIVETIYSPALPHIAQAFEVSSQLASQTLSVYFIAFALGVVFWGRAADTFGRRPAMIAGLLTYGIGSIIALLANSFELLLLARVISAFGAATGSVVTQTILRDSFDSTELAKMFSLMAMGLSLSPIIGLMAGGTLARFLGHTGIFTLLLILALVLLAMTIRSLAETKPDKQPNIKLTALALRMCRDSKIWQSAAMVALFNLMLFSYYSLGPFLFTKLGFTSLEFGYSGLVLAVGAFIGSYINTALLSKGLQPQQLTKLAAMIALLSAIGICLIGEQLLFLLPMLGIVISFGVAIPNTLSQALTDYKEVAGSAGALLGLCYYLLLGAGLVLAGHVQHLGLVLLASALLACLLSLKSVSRSLPAT
ncbi:Bcr/CflA family efflux MFS transporter [Shewanella sp. UCD-KL12]|uniref:Bcr/CflA family efflux MFS transporter n=1 Tax=Shewanella sp. UCD-KL12 TaxID=1917163 RepID=UPI00097115D1|nr:Bcr/CflA family efflux MFS transporter [Shewanella sp. UCD-KL12]